MIGDAGVPRHGGAAALPRRRGRRVRRRAHVRGPGRRRRAVGRVRRRPRSTAGWSGRRVPLRDPRLGRRHPDPERRRLRPGGRRDDRRGRTSTTGVDDTVRRMSPAECGFAYRTSIFKHSDRWVVLSVDFRLARVPRVGADPLRRTGPGARRGAGRPGRRWRRPGPRCARLRAGKGMVLDPADHGHLVGRFVLHQPGARRRRLRGPARPAGGVGEPPSWPGPDGAVKVSAAWLIEQAGFTKGYGGRAGWRSPASTRWR